MWKFIIKSIFFLSPFVFLYFFIPYFYAVDQGDLYRMGYFHREDNYRAQFGNDLHDIELSTNLTFIDTCTNKSKLSILVIGDSFSEWRGFSFHNYLAKDDTISVFYEIGGNPVENLYAIANGDFFDKIPIDYVILESVERGFPARANLNPDSQISLSEIKQTVKKKPDRFRKNVPLNNCVVKYFGINIYRLFKKGCVSGVYDFEATKPVFTTHRENRLLVFEMDIYHLPENSDTTNILKLNDVLNHLSGLISEKGSKLIVLPAPDKYSVYHDYIKDREKNPQPVFFDILKLPEKQYIYIESNDILKNAVSSGIKDIYFADDTHWSPVGAKLIADAVRSKLK